MMKKGHIASLIVRGGPYGSFFEGFRLNAGEYAISQLADGEYNLYLKQPDDFENAWLKERVAWLEKRNEHLHELLSEALSILKSKPE